MISSFDPADASEYGVHCALVLNLLATLADFEMYIHSDDCYGWIRCSASTMQKQLPFLSVKQIRTATNKLVSLGVLLSRPYLEDSRDRTAHYAFPDQTFTREVIDG